MSNYLAGQIVGSLELLVPEMRGPGRKYWHVRCTVCGTEKAVRLDHLRTYANHGCRCDLNSRSGRPGPAKTHGNSRKREHAIWAKMLDRCRNPSSDNYRFYGGLGHYVCIRWGSFEAFHEDMGDAPSAGHTLDRIDTHGSYTCGKCDECIAVGAPANCRWTTKDVQMRNMKSNLWYTHGGRTLILKDWARLRGIGYLTLYSRIKRGWTFEQAIAVPALNKWKRGRGKSNAPVIVGGEGNIVINNRPESEGPSSS